MQMRILCSDGRRMVRFETSTSRYGLVGTLDCKADVAIEKDCQVRSSDCIQRFETCREAHCEACCQVYNNCAYKGEGEGGCSCKERECV